MKDLPDIALLALAGTLDGALLHTAIERTFAHRGTHPVPSTCPAASTAWAPTYERMAQVDDLRWRKLDDLEIAVRAFLDPVLATAPTGTWDPSDWTWRG